MYVSRVLRATCPVTLEIVHLKTQLRSVHLKDAHDNWRWTCTYLLGAEDAGLCHGHVAGGPGGDCGRARTPELQRTVVRIVSAAAVEGNAGKYHPIDGTLPREIARQWNEAGCRATSSISMFIHFSSDTTPCLDEARTEARPNNDDLPETGQYRWR